MVERASLQSAAAKPERRRAERAGVADVVADEDERARPELALDYLSGKLSSFDTQGREWLVEQHELARRRERTGECHGLLFTT
jgi:hypothetical protein